MLLGRWYALGDRVLTELGQRKLWPEHFDLAVDLALPNGRRTNVGFSPGDSTSAAPYVYVGPHDLNGLDDPYWNVPFGAALPYADVIGSGDPEAAATAFVKTGLRLLERA